VISDRPHILDVTPDGLARWLRDAGEPRFRLDQVLGWLYRRQAESPDAMTNLSRGLRRRLDEAFEFAPPQPVAGQVSADGATGKLLLELDDDERVECVWMASRHGQQARTEPVECGDSIAAVRPSLRTAAAPERTSRHNPEPGPGRNARAAAGAAFTFCISSQVGCALGCRFCATGADGFVRDLATAEIVGQVLALARRVGRPRNVVFMGMGEPLRNVGAVVLAIAALTDEQRFGLGAQRVTVSTAGIEPGIRALAASGLRPHLALSLNSPFEAERCELMPVTRRHSLDAVLDACETYSARTGRRLLIEYVLLGGANTSARHAKAVARIARRLGALVNLIPFNAVAGSRFAPPARHEVKAFRSVLEREGAAVSERYRRGRDIDAACGQLRSRKCVRV
jgi:23S rRNA (adenine2503-C2)-methyltransferase